MSGNSIKAGGCLSLVFQGLHELKEARRKPPCTAGCETHHLSLVLALLPDVAQHVSELGLLLIHFIKAVLGILFLSF